MGAKSGGVYTSRAVQRENEADGDVGNPRRESENERGMPSSLFYRSPPETVLVGGFVRGRGRTTPLGSVGDTGVVAAAVAAMGNDGMSGEGRKGWGRYSRVKEESREKRDRWRHERGDGG